MCHVSIYNSSCPALSCPLSCPSAHLLLVHGGLVQRLLAVHLVCAHMDEAPNTHVLGGLKHHMGAHDVVLSELKRVSERVVDVCLGGEVHDCVDLFCLQHVLDELRGAYVSTHELIVGKILHHVAVLNAGAIWQNEKCK